MSRYKPRGWFGEPYRHYLAAKGVSTKRRASMRDAKHLAAKGIKTKNRGITNSLFASKAKPQKYDMGTLVTFGTDQYEIIDFDENAGYYTLITDEGKTKYVREEQIDPMMFSRKYFVRNKLKGNRESSALHRAYAKGWTKDELRSNPEIRERFGVSLQELEPKRSQNLPESTSRAEEGVGLQTDFDTLTTVEIPRTQQEPEFKEELAFEPQSEPAQEIPKMGADDMLQEDAGIKEEDMKFDDPVMPAGAGSMNSQITTPGVPRRSSLAQQL